MTKYKPLHLLLKDIRNRIGKARSLDDVYCQLIVEGYLTFSEEELLNHLLKDGRFEFQNDGGVHSTLLKDQRKSK